MSKEQDAELIAMTLAGDEVAFSHLVIQYRNAVYTIIYTMMGNHHEADDVAQEVFLRAYFSLRSFKGMSAFSTWLYRIAVNQSLNALKKNKRHVVSLDEELFGDGDGTARIDTIVDKADPPDHRAERNDTKKRVHAVILALPANYRMVVTLRDIQGMAYEEVADIMNIPVNTVRTWLFRARQILKERMEVDAHGL